MAADRLRQIANEYHQKWSTSSAWVKGCIEYIETDCNLLASRGLFAVEYTNGIDHMGSNLVYPKEFRFSFKDSDSINDVILYLKSEGFNVRWILRESMRDFKILRISWK